MMMARRAPLAALLLLGLIASAAPFRRSAPRRSRAALTRRSVAEESNIIDNLTATAKKEITFVTSNDMKLREVQMILGDDFPATVKRVDIDLYELQGDPEDPDLISREKCRLAAEKVDGPVFVEDTSLFLDELNGLPGPYIKWFLDSLGCEGIFRLLGPNGSRGAKAQCALAFSRGRGDEPVVFKGVCEGRMVDPKGSSGFGWDSIFAADGFERTFAEMSREEKNELSHRAKALQMFNEYLKENPL